MSDTSFARHLAQYGPEAVARQATSAPLSLAEAQAYCRQLAEQHYENFSVASLLLPKRIRRHFYPIYAYCRWADDLGDEVGDPERALTLLDWWQSQLEACYQGQATHPVFIALGPTIAECEIPQHEFADLLIAFRQDQTITRYANHEQLLAYCRYSANPVGHLVLYAGGCFNTRNAQLADNICTGLQLANFWQDVARDYQIGRIYLPHEEMSHVGYSEEQLARGEMNEAFAKLLKLQVGRAEALLLAGQPLVSLVPRDMRIDVELFLQGGLAILEEIRRQQYDVLRRRPVVSKTRKLRLLLSAWWRSRFTRSRGAQ